MLRFLLSLYRSVRNPPSPSSESIVRRLFYRHGALISRYWLAIMLTAVTTGVFFAYPAVFMSDFRPWTVDSLPHHVWTSPVSFESQAEKQPDLEMRQVWLMGDYMQALNVSVLSEAFRLEEELLRGSRGTKDGQSWAVHSPGLFWRNSMDALRADNDLHNTINTFDGQVAFSELDLWPLSVFAGKAFLGSKLVAADAVVLTLLSRSNNEVAQEWDTNVKAMSESPDTSPWVVHNSQDAFATDEIYEYKFQPFSINQYWALVGAYVCMLAYTAASLRRLRAFKSRFGVIMTAIIQMMTSVLASFTMCGLLRINLAQIPQEAYPFVVLVIGLENIFRLINAILAYPPQMDTTQRVANGLGDTGVASSISAGQNLLILWLLSQVVSPGVAAFCAFAAIALIFDYFYLLTFFVAVLSVDIRRMELQDCLHRPRGNSRRRKRSRERNSFIDGLIRGKVPISTRMAGSAITVAFVLLLNWHLSDNDVSFFGISPWSSPSAKQYLPAFGAEQTTNTSLNSWSNSQNVSTAATQFMHVVRPGATSFTAKVFAPVLILVKGADRTGIPVTQITWLSAVRSLATHHFYPFALAVVFMVTSTTVLMSILLWEWEERWENGDMDADDGPLACRTIQTDHTLDIELLTSSPSGSFLSVGIDRTLTLALGHKSTKGYNKVAVEAAPNFRSVFKQDQRHLSWPVDACALDARAERLAILCRNAMVLLGKTNDATMSGVDPGKRDEAPILFEFVHVTTKTTKVECVLLTLYRHGALSELYQDSGRLQVNHLDVGEHGIATAVVHIREGNDPIIMVLTTTGAVVQCRWQRATDSWELLKIPNNCNPPQIAARQARGACLKSVPALDIVLLSDRWGDIHIINALTLERGPTLAFPGEDPQSVHVLHSEPYHITGYDLPVCDIFCITYTTTTHDETTLNIRTWADSTLPICPASRDTSLAHFRTLSSRSTFSSLDSPGKWAPTSNLGVAGVRRVPTIKPARNLEPTMRRRIPAQKEQEIAWQAYSFSHTGELHTLPVKETGSLYAHALGPVVRLGRDGVGVALGNAIIAVEVRGSFVGEKDVPLVRRSGSRKRVNGRMGRGRDA